MKTLQQIIATAMLASATLLSACKREVQKPEETKPDANQISYDTGMEMLDGIGYPATYVPRGDRKVLLNHHYMKQLDGIGYPAGHDYDRVQALEDRYKTQLTEGY